MTMKTSKYVAQLVNFLLGIWLIISSFAWTHTHAQFANAWVVGVLVALTGIISIWAPTLRVVNTILAIWLFLSSWALRGSSTGTIWNNVLVAIAVFLISFTVNEPHQPSAGSPARHPA